MDKKDEKLQPLQLIPAVKNENIEDVKNLFRELERRVEQKKKDEEGYTPLLIIMAQLGNAKFLKQLGRTKLDFDVNILDNKGFSALQYVLNRRNLDDAKILIDAGADVDGRDTYFGETALHVSVQNKNIEMCEYLLSKGANVNMKDNNFYHTPLHKAALHSDGNSYLSIHEFLLKKGADINVQDANGNTPLHFLVSKSSNINVIKLFLSRLANVNLKNNYGKNPLFVAVLKGGPEIVQLLINHGSDVKCTSNIKSTPLHEAAKSNYYDVAEILLKNGADVNAQDDEKNIKTTGLKTPLHCNTSTKMVRLFLNYKPNLNLQDTAGETPLVKAIRLLHSDSVQLLIEHGADVKIINPKNGSTPLHEVTCYKIYKYLLKNGADANALDGEGRAPLMCILNLMKDWDFEIGIYTLIFFLKYTDINMVDSNKDTVFNFTGNKETTRKTILRHLAVLQALDFSLHPRIVETIMNEDFLTRYFQKCVKELTKAKKTKLRKSEATFFNFLTDDKNKLKNYALSTDLVHEFKKSRCAVKFPIYGESMQDNMFKGIERKHLCVESSMKLSNHLPIFKPSNFIMRDILDCVSNEELSKFCPKNLKRVHNQ